MQDMFLARFIPLLAVLLPLTTLAVADALVYVHNGVQLGTVDLSTGAFHQVGPDFPDGSQGLGYAPNGSLLTMAFNGNLDSINPVTGVMTSIGPSGLSDCSTPSSPCAANSVNVLASFNGQTYVTDFQNRLYRVNTATGTATSIGLTGVPAIPFIPLSENPDGTVNFYDEAFFEANGKLYATFDTGRADFATGENTPVIANMLYQIDPATARANAIGPTAFGLGAAVEVNGTTYAFLNATHQIARLDLATGGTTVIGDFDEATGIVSAAVPTPEPATTAIVAFGLGAIIALSRVRSRINNSSEA
jgi:hypothetical protein